MSLISTPDTLLHNFQSIVNHLAHTSYLGRVQSEMVRKKMTLHSNATVHATEAIIIALRPGAELFVIGTGFDSGKEIFSLQICQKSRRIGCVIPLVSYNMVSRSLSFDFLDITLRPELSSKSNSNQHCKGCERGYANLLTSTFASVHPS